MTQIGLLYRFDEMPDIVRGLAQMGSEIDIVVYEFREESEIVLFPLLMSSVVGFAHLGDGNPEISALYDMSNFPSTDKNLRFQLF